MYLPSFLADVLFDVCSLYRALHLALSAQRSLRYSNTSVLSASACWNNLPGELSDPTGSPLLCFRWQLNWASWGCTCPPCSPTCLQELCRARPPPGSPTGDRQVSPPLWSWRRPEPRRHRGWPALDRSPTLPVALWVYREKCRRWPPPRPLFNLKSGLHRQTQVWNHVHKTHKDPIHH